MPKLPEFDPIQFLLVRKFGVPGAFGGLTLPTSAGHRSMGDPEVAAPIKDYRSYLEKLPKTELEALVASERAKQKQEQNEKAEREERQRFFNQPFARADFDHWSRAAHWTLDEAIALSFGKAPEIVTWEKVNPLTQVSPFAFQYHRRRDLALRAVVWKQLYDPVLPAIFLAWAERLDIAVSQELIAAVTARGVKIQDWQTAYGELKKLYDDLKKLYDDLRKQHHENHARWMEIVKERDSLIDALRVQLSELQSDEASAASEPDASKQKSLSVRERESLLKLVIGMAMKGYAYDPKSGRTSTAREIADDLRLIGLSLDEDTIRKYLGEAKDLLPRDETEQNG